MSDESYTEVPAMDILFDVRENKPMSTYDVVGKLVVRARPETAVAQCQLSINTTTLQEMGAADGMAIVRSEILNQFLDLAKEIQKCVEGKISQGKAKGSKTSDGGAI